MKNVIGALIFTLYYIVSAGVIVLISRYVPQSRPYIRKAYHLMATFSVLVLLHVFEHWHAAAASAAIFYSFAFVLVCIAQRIPALNKLSVARGGRLSEIPVQIIYFQLTVVALTTLYWGSIGPIGKVAIAAGFSALGVGDAAAELVGKRFGRHRFRCGLFDPKKSWEGTLAMIGASYVVILSILLTMSTALVSFLAAPVLAVFAGVAEAFSRKGADTVLVPVTVAVLTLPVVTLVSNIVQVLGYN
ncbi:MAG TPA: phosphatidate cytidylyltransferase [Firmicutes bacterium]|jgi:phytol kinase|nr:phosphatidate cytidylyltransferase [Bacillota bacterium]